MDIVTGDDISFSVQLRKGIIGKEQTFTINPAATVEAKIISSNKQEIFPITTCTPSQTGADWANSLIVIEWASADTINVTYEGPASLEIQIDDGSKETYFDRVVIRQGTIA